MKLIELDITLNTLLRKSKWITAIKFLKEVTNDKAGLRECKDIIDECRQGLFVKYKQYQVDYKYCIRSSKLDIYKYLV